jgi:hypothetical protein
MAEPKTLQNTKQNKILQLASNMSTSCAKLSNRSEAPISVGSTHAGLSTSQKAVYT